MAENLFVGRERELTRLNAFLDRALLGHGQVAFVTGEAGSGKTALVGAFLDQARTAHEDLLVAMGNCNAQSGIGDPYLPFREVLASLTGLADERTAQPAIGHGDDRLKSLLVRSTQVLVEFGPDLVGTRSIRRPQPDDQFARATRST
jgi:predicted ATPase